MTTNQRAESVRQVSYREESRGRAKERRRRRAETLHSTQAALAGDRMESSTAESESAAEAEREAESTPHN